MNDVILTGYTGPGTYSTDQVTAEAGFGMVIDDKQFDMDSTDGTTASVTVNADASGTATFKKLEIRASFYTASRRGRDLLLDLRRLTPPFPSCPGPDTGAGPAVRDPHGGPDRKPVPYGHGPTLRRTGQWTA